MALANLTTAQVRLVHNGDERVVDLTELLRDGEPITYFNNVANDPDLREQMVSRMGDYIDQVGSLTGYTVTRAGNTGNFLISPKAIYG